MFQNIQFHVKVCEDSRLFIKAKDQNLRIFLGTQILAVCLKKKNNKKLSIEL